MRNFKLLLWSFVLLSACGENQDKSKTEIVTAAADSTGFHPASIKEQVTYQRAVEAAVWGIPAVNFQLMYEALPK